MPKPSWEESPVLLACLLAQILVYKQRCITSQRWLAQSRRLIGRSFLSVTSVWTSLVRELLWVNSEYPLLLGWRPSLYFNIVLGQQSPSQVGLGGISFAQHRRIQPAQSASLSQVTHPQWQNRMSQVEAVNHCISIFPVRLFTVTFCNTSPAKHFWTYHHTHHQWPTIVL